MIVRSTKKVEKQDTDGSPHHDDAMTSVLALWTGIADTAQKNSSSPVSII